MLDTLCERVGCVCEESKRDFYGHDLSGSHTPHECLRLLCMHLDMEFSQLLNMLTLGPHYCCMGFVKIVTPATNLLFNSTQIRLCHNHLPAIKLKKRGGGVSKLSKSRDLIKRPKLV